MILRLFSVIIIFMIKVTIETKNKLINSFEVEREDDFLSTLDKFLKIDRIGLSDLLSISVDCQGQDDSISCRMAKVSAEAISLANIK